MFRTKQPAHRGRGRLEQDESDEEQRHSQIQVIWSRTNVFDEACGTQVREYQPYMCHRGYCHRVW